MNFLQKGLDKAAASWYHVTCRQATWCHGSVGRAHRSHRWGRRFESYWHHANKKSSLVGGFFVCLRYEKRNRDALRGERTSMGRRSLAPPVVDEARRRRYLTERSETVGSSPTGTTQTKSHPLGGELLRNNLSHNEKRRASGEHAGCSFAYGAPIYAMHGYRAYNCALT